MSKTHIVEEGDCLASIARQYGFSDCKTLYDHPENQELKADRKNPHMLAKGDRVFIPDPTPKEVDISLDTPVQITVSVPEVKLCLVILNEKEEPAANKKYRLFDGFDKSGTTDGSGKIEVPVPPDVDECKLEVWIEDDPEAPRCFHLRIGRLADVKTVKGVQGRLANLGLYRGKLDGKAASVSSALKNFQKAHGLTANGDPTDAKTQDKLVEVHDGG